MTEITITEEDLSTVLRTKVNEITNLQIAITSLQRVVSERDTYIAELEGKISGVNGKEAFDAKSREEEVPVQ